MSEMDVLAGGTVLLGLDAATEEEVICRLIQSLADRPEVKDVVGFQQAVLERQKVQPPLLGHGVALPHARTGTVSDMVLAIGRCRENVAFGLDAAPVKLVFLFGVPVTCISEYLAAVSRLTRLLRKPGVMEGLLKAENENAFRGILTESENAY